MTGHPSDDPGDIEVTPAMIVAGLDAYYAADSRFGAEPADLVEDVFRAMLKAADSRP